MIQKLLAVAAILLVVGPVAAQPAPKKLDDKVLVTKVYDLKSVLGERAKAAGIADMDAVIRLMLEGGTIGGLTPHNSASPQLTERDGGKLEVRATARVQQEVANFIDAMHRLTDLAVDVKADVLEFEPAAYEKWLKAIPASAKGKAGSPVVFSTGSDLDEKEPTAEEKKAFEEASKLLRAGNEVQTSTARFVSGIDSTFSARHPVRTFSSSPVVSVSGPTKFVKEGFQLTGLPVISIDRRYIRLKLTEQSSIVTGIKQRQFADVNGQKLTDVGPQIEDLGSTGSTTIADGGTVVFRLAYAPKDKVWVVVLSPTIFIQAEEDFRKKEQKK